MSRSARIAERAREPRWTKPPRRIEPAECIACNSCVRSCPSEFGAIFNHGMDVVSFRSLAQVAPATP